MCYSIPETQGIVPKTLRGQKLIVALSLQWAKPGIFV